MYNISYKICQMNRKPFLYVVMRDILIKHGKLVYLVAYIWVQSSISSEGSPSGAQTRDPGVKFAP